MPISLGFWEWGCPKRGVAHITVTPARLAERVWCTKSQSSVGSRPHSYLFTSAMDRIDCTKVWHKHYLIYVTLHARSLDRRSAKQRQRGLWGQDCLNVFYYTVTTNRKPHKAHFIQQKLLRHLQVEWVELFFLDLFPLFQSQHYHHPHMGIQAM